MLLFLNDVAGTEILLILVFILIFFGSKSIPGIARSVGRTMRQIKDATQEVQNEITKSGMDIRNDLNIRRSVEETLSDIKRPLDQQAEELQHVLNDSAPYRKTAGPISETQPQDQNDPVEESKINPSNPSGE